MVRNWQNRRMTISLLGLMLTALSVVHVRADDTPGAGAGGNAGAGAANNAKDKSKDITLSGELSAFRLTVVNGLITYVNGHKQARIDLAWDYLPEDDTLRELRTHSFQGLHTFHLSNARLIGAKIGKPRPDQADYGSPLSASPTVATMAAAEQDISNALQQGEVPTRKQLNDWDRMFTRFWQGRDGFGLEAFHAGILRSDEYLGMVFEHRMLDYLLRSEGVRFVVTVVDSDHDPIILDKNIVWNIQQTHFKRAFPDAKRNPGNEPLPIYRYVMSANSRNLHLSIPDAAVKNANDAGAGKATISTVASWRTELDEAGITFLNPPDINFKDEQVDAAPIVPKATLDAVTPLKPEGDPSQLQAALQFGANTSLGDLALKGFLSGSKNETLYTGALISGNKVSQIVGISRENDPLAAFRYGPVIGYQTSAPNALFAGFGFAYGLFQVHGGFRVANDGGTNGDKLSVREGWSVSVDLSRAFGQRNGISEVKLKSAVTTGGLQRSTLANLEARRFAGFVRLPGSNTTPLIVSIVSVPKDASEKPKTYAIVIPKEGLLQGTDVFLPLGSYRFDPPGGYAFARAAGNQLIRNEDGSLLFALPGADGHFSFVLSSARSGGVTPAYGLVPISPGFAQISVARDTDAPPAVSVTLKSRDANTEITRQITVDGKFQTLNLPPGDYGLALSDATVTLVMVKPDHTEAPVETWNDEPLKGQYQFKIAPYDPLKPDANKFAFRIKKR